MRFRFKADVHFDADDAKQAMLRIAKHCIGIANAFDGKDAPEETWFVGEMKLGPEEEKGEERKWRSRSGNT